MGMLVIKSEEEEQPLGRVGSGQYSNANMLILVT